MILTIKKTHENTHTVKIYQRIDNRYILKATFNKNHEINGKIKVIDVYNIPYKNAKGFYNTEEYLIHLVGRFDYEIIEKVDFFSSSIREELMVKEKENENTNKLAEALKSIKEECKKHPNGPSDCKRCPFGSKYGVCGVLEFPPEKWELKSDDTDSVDRLFR